LAKLNDLFDATRTSLNDRIDQIYSEASGSLAALINEANQLSETPNPTGTKEVSDRLDQVVSNVQPLLDSNSNPEQVAELNRLVEMARKSRENLEDVDNNLKAFLAQRDVVNDLVDSANEELNAISDKELRPTGEAQNDIQELKVNTVYVNVY
jgi:hypothetical protein